MKKNPPAGPSKNQNNRSSQSLNPPPPPSPKLSNAGNKSKGRKSRARSSSTEQYQKGKKKGRSKSLKSKSKKGAKGSIKNNGSKSKPSQVFSSEADLTSPGEETDGGVNQRSSRPTFQTLANQRGSDDQPSTTTMDNRQLPPKATTGFAVGKGQRRSSAVPPENVPSPQYPLSNSTGDMNPRRDSSGPIPSLDQPPQQQQQQQQGPSSVRNSSWSSPKKNSIEQPDPGALPPKRSLRPSLVPAPSNPEEPTRKSRGAIRLSQVDPEEAKRIQQQQQQQQQKEPRRLSLLKEKPQDELNSPGGEEQRRLSSIPEGQESRRTTPEHLNYGQAQYPRQDDEQGQGLLSEGRTSDDVRESPTVGSLIEKTRRRSSSMRRGSLHSRPGSEDTYEVTLYNNSRPGSFDPAFKEHKAHLITPQTLYKEALYTSVHYLGVPTVRFPATKEDLALYSHVVFQAEPKEQVAAMEHVVGEPFPLTVVNTKVRRADGVEPRDLKRLPDSYCIVAIETVDSAVEFQLGIKEWQAISTGSPLRPRTVKPPEDQTRRPPEKRFDQVYEKVPPFIKTSIQLQTRTPIWEQRFQCLALRPSVDTLTIEIWDNEANPPGKEKNSISSRSGSRLSVKTGPHDVFSGKVSIPVKDIPCEGESKWHYIKGTTHRKKEAMGRLLVDTWLTHAYRHGRNHEEYAEPRMMLEMLWDHILFYESSRFKGEWNGDIPPAATCLIFQYALQTGISEASQAVIRWNAYAKYNLGLFALERRLTELEVALERAKEWKDMRECELESQMIVMAVERILPVIRNHLNEPQDRVHEAVKAITHTRDILKKFSCKQGMFQLQSWIENEIRMAILEWYEVKFKEFITVNRDAPIYELVECMAKLINEVNALMRECVLTWKPLFWLDGLIEYMPLAYDEFQKMIIHDVEMICFVCLEPYDTNEKLRYLLLSMDMDARALCRALFDLYVETQVFVLDQEQVFQSMQHERYFALNQYHRWFRPVLVLWLGYALIKAADMISTAIDLDTVNPQDEFVLTSTSATDAGVVYHQLASFWEQLNWPDIAEGYVILHYLFEVMCFVTVIYARLKRAKLEKEGYFDTIDRFDISERLCTALNNIEHVKESLIKIPDQINMDSILVELDKAIGESGKYGAKEHRLRINFILTATLTIIELQFKKIMNGISDRVRPQLREGFIECFLFLQDSTKTEDDSLVPILAYLEDNIVILHKSLLELNFVRVLQMFWNTACQELQTRLKNFMEEEDARNHDLFFNRVRKILAILVTYFEGGGGGLTEAECDTKHYRSVCLFLNCLQMPTDALIAAFYRETAEEHLENKNQSSLGSITVHVTYHSGVLAVQVLSAKNLSARDEPLPMFSMCRKPVPSSDPQVEVTLEPPLHFKTLKKQKTEVQWKTLNPVWNQKFTWSITEDLCLKPDAVLVFTVRDYDQLSRDDFLGHAVVSLAKMPGLMKMRPTPQPMTLELRSVDIKHNPVLSIMANRRWDSEATNFFSNMKSRVITLKDDAPVRLQRIKSE